MNHAIETLTQQAETSENNAPIWRSQHNQKQAELAEKTAADCRAAIEVLSQGEGLGINLDSDAPLAGACDLSKEGGCEACQ